MKKIIVFCLLSVISSITTAQISKDEKVEQLKNREDVKVTEVGNDLLKIEFRNGKTLYKNIADYQPLTTYNPQPTYDSTIIDLTTIDTILYYQKYSFWQEVPLGKGPNDYLLIGDINNNKLTELYGRMKDYTTEVTDVVIMEMNKQNSFDSVYTYDSTTFARNIHDINKDGLDEIHIVSVDAFAIPVNKFKFFEQLTDTSLALDLAFIFSPSDSVSISNSQQDDNLFGDWDGDNLTDQIFHTLGIGLHIYEYNPLIPDFDSVYFYDYTSINQEFAGFTTGDFDQDGKTEFFTGSTHGDVLCIENTGNNSYAPTWVGMVETYNAYQPAQTNDVDGNGKKEIWVGGDAFYPGIGPMTRITLFESDGNDSYQVVGRIDLIGIFSFFAQNYQAIDVDKDGIEEMMICIEQTVLILKFNGTPDHQTYELFYFKQNDLALAGRNSVYYGAVMYDLTNDGKEEITISLDDIIENIGLRRFSFIYKPEFTIDVNDDVISQPDKFNLHPNYPNPFNPETKINFDIPSISKASLKVYNILGKEVDNLLEKELSPGSYTISWEAKDSNGKLLPSGVYLIRFTAGNYTKTIKALLLK
jgi:hypothetical protein